MEVTPEDLADPLAATRIHAALTQQGLNNAGGGIKQTFTRTALRDHAQLMQVHVVAPTHLTHLLLSAMLERGYGRIIQVSSLAGLMPGAPTSTCIQLPSRSWSNLLNHWPRSCGGQGYMYALSAPGFTRSEFHDVMGTRAVVSKLPRFMWQDARSAAREGITAVHRNKTVYVTGPVNQLLASAVRLLTPGLARKVMRKQAGRYRSIPPRGNPA